MTKRVNFYKFRGVLCIDFHGDLCVRNTNGKLLNVRKSNNYEQLKRMYYKTRLTEIRVEVKFKSYRNQRDIMTYQKYVQQPFKIESVETY